MGCRATPGAAPLRHRPALHRRWQLPAKSAAVHAIRQLEYSTTTLHIHRTSPVAYRSIALQLMNESSSRLAYTPELTACDAANHYRSRRDGRGSNILQSRHGSAVGGNHVRVETRQLAVCCITGKRSHESAATRCDARDKQRCAPISLRRYHGS